MRRYVSGKVDPPQRWQTEKTAKLIFRFFTVQTEGDTGMIIEMKIFSDYI
jgi:hypothetical protein